MSVSLGFGTVQFGVPYGVTNVHGVPTNTEVHAILDCATQSGIKILDTAPGYGNAEARIGESNQSHNFSLVTKLAALSTLDPSAIEETINTSITRSCERMQCKQLYGVLLHDPKDLDSPHAARIVDALIAAKQAGLVKKVGVSVYTASDIEKALKLFIPDIVQCPVNVFDQRLIANGDLLRLEATGTEIHLRSIFLQGLLLAKPKTLPASLRSSEEKISAWHNYWSERQMSSLIGALSFVRSLPVSAVALAGVATSAELQEIIAAWNDVSEEKFDYSTFACADTALIDPRTWK